MVRLRRASRRRSATSRRRPPPPAIFATVMLSFKLKSAAAAASSSATRMSTSSTHHRHVHGSSADQRLVPRLIRLVHGCGAYGGGGCRGGRRASCRHRRGSQGAEAKAGARRGSALIARRRSGGRVACRACRVHAGRRARECVGAERDEVDGGRCCVAAALLAMLSGARGLRRFGWDEPCPARDWSVPRASATHCRYSNEYDPPLNYLLDTVPVPVPVRYRYAVPR